MQTPRVRFLFSLLLVFGSATGAVAGPIMGRVVDPDGRAVPAASVLLVRGGTVVTRTASDADGAFTLRSPDEGTFEVRVAANGFRAAPIRVDGSAEPRDVGTVALAVSAVSESVVVSASQTEIPLSMTGSSVTVMTGEELLARQTETLADALRLVPGLTVAASGGRGAITSVFPRGGESDYSLVLIDGVAANAFGGGFDFAHVSIANVDRIEIVRGPESALYGSNAIGSVIRVITRRGGPPTAQASFEGGGFGTTRVTAAGSGELAAWRWGAAAERLATDGMNGERSPAGETIVNDDYTRTNVSGGGGWSRSDGTDVHGDLTYMRDERGFPGPFGSDPSGSFDGIDTISRGHDERWLTSISGTVPFGRVRTHGQLSHSRVDSSFVSGFGTSESSSRRTTVRFQADATLVRFLDGSAGVEVQRERAGSTFITADGSRQVPVQRTLTGIFGEARWNRPSRLFMTAGLRVDRITRDALPGDPEAFAPRPDFGDDTVVSANPKIAAAWFVRAADGDFTKLRASAGTGIRPPDAIEIAFSDNPSLKPERSRSADVGVEQALLRGRALVEGTAFFNSYDDLIVAVGAFRGSSRFRTDNISNARARGLELSGTVRPLRTTAPLDLRVRLTYALLDTEILAVDRAAAAPPPFSVGDALLRRPRHRFAGDVLVQAGRLNGYLEGDGRGRVRDVDPSLGTFGGIFDATGYTVWHAGIGWKLMPRVELFGRIDNVFDRHYEEVLGFPALGRSALAGFRVATRR